MSKNTFVERTVPGWEILDKVERLFKAGVDMEAIPLEWTIGQLMALKEFDTVTYCQYCRKRTDVCNCLGD